MFAMEILVFKTNVSDRGHIESVRPHLRKLDDILKWNFDLLDEDYILRIEATNRLNPREVERALYQAGYDCQVLQTFSGA